MKTLIILIITTIFSAFYTGHTKEKLVFTTSSFNESKIVKLNGTRYSLTIKKKCNETGEPPYECWTSIKFTPDNYPDLKVDGDAFSFSEADINQDGVDEFLALSANGGNWRQVYVFAIADPTMTSGPFWYQPIESFMWYSGFGGDNFCDARIYWLEDKNQVKVLTTNVAEEDFKCTDVRIFDWTTK